MEENPAPADIARLEVHIEALRDSIARCRKIAFAAKLAIAAGALWLALTLVWLVPFIVALVVAAMAAVIGGIVLAGSNSTTWQQTEARLRNSGGAAGGDDRRDRDAGGGRKQDLALRAAAGLRQQPSGRRDFLRQHAGRERLAALVHRNDADRFRRDAATVAIADGAGDAGEIVGRGQRPAHG